MRSEPPFRTFTPEEQKAARASGLRSMDKPCNCEGGFHLMMCEECQAGRHRHGCNLVNAEGCRQEMVWLRKTGQRALAAERTSSGSIAQEAMRALEAAGFLFPIPRNSRLYMEPCCDTCWLPVDDLDAEELWCSNERSDALWAIEPNPLGSMGASG